MSFKTVEGVLASALATSGTFNFAYPSGFSKGDFVQSAGHRIVFGGNDVYKAPKDFTVSFGANSAGVTVTWNNATTIAANRRWTIQLERQGQNDGRPKDPTVFGKMVQLQTYRVNLGSPATADANGYVESQDLTAAGVFSVDTTAAAALAAAALNGEADVPRNVVAAWTGAAVLTITGEDEFGNVMVESSASGTSHTGKKAFKKVTGISTSANITALTVGTGVVFGLPVFLPHKNNVAREYQDGALLPQIGGNVVYLTGLQTEANVDAGTSLWLPCPVAGVIRKMSTIQQSGVTTGGTVTLEVNTVAVNGLGVVVADSAAAGDVDSDTPTYGHASTVVAVGDSLEVVFPAAFNASADVLVVIEIEATKDTHGTVVAGLSGSAQSATGNDVRGTYAPAATPDGSIGFVLDLLLADPAYQGELPYSG